MFTRKLSIRDIGDGKNFIVTEPFEYKTYAKIGRKYTLLTVKVAEQFLTDLASVPRLAQLIVPKISKANQSSVTHDWLYRERTIWLISYHSGQMVETEHIITSRKEADDIYLGAMKCSGVKFKRRYAIYWGVRVGGWVHWNKCTDCR